MCSCSCNFQNCIAVFSRVPLFSPAAKAINPISPSCLLSFTQWITDREDTPNLTLMALPNRKEQFYTAQASLGWCIAHSACLPLPFTNIFLIFWSRLMHNWLLTILKYGFWAGKWNLLCRNSLCSCCYRAHQTKNNARTNPYFVRRIEVSEYHLSWRCHKLERGWNMIWDCFVCALLRQAVPLKKHTLTNSIELTIEISEFVILSF